MKVENLDQDAEIESRPLRILDASAQERAHAIVVRDHPPIKQE